MKKLGLTLSLISSLFLCTACVSEDATSVKLTVAASSSASGVVLLNYITIMVSHLWMMVATSSGIQMDSTQPYMNADRIILVRLNLLMRNLSL